MTASIIDGKTIAAGIRSEIAAAVARRVEAGRRPPGLATILVGEDPASASYVRSKGKACRDAGFHSIQVNLETDAPEEELLALVEKFNADPAIDGILVQLPLPPQMAEERVLARIDPTKDVDGFHPVNAGNLSLGRACFVPCTPLGIVELLARSAVTTRGAHAIVVGRSNIVGRPVAQLLSRKGPSGDATVTLCHSATQDLASHTRRADILVAAVGRPGAITGDMIKPGAVVIDVGVNRIDDLNAPRGYRLVGDVDFEAAARVASRITPVPGGVGPMTIAMLLRNTLDSAQRRDAR